MNPYIPIVEIETIDHNKISLKNGKILYNYGGDIGVSTLYVKVSTVKIDLTFNKDGIRIYSQELLALRSHIDKLKLQLIEDGKEKLRLRPISTSNLNVKINFLSNQSQARLIPAYNSSYETITTKTNDDFIKNIIKYYPPITNFKSNIDICGDFVLQFYIHKQNNFCSIVIYDADISYNYNKNRNKLISNVDTIKKTLKTLQI